MHNLYSFLLLIIIASCSTKIRYIGKQFPSTNNIEIFVSENSLNQPYTIIGKGYLSKFGILYNPEKIQRKAMAKGITIGADAVLLMDYFIPDTGGTQFNSIFRTDSIGKGVISAGSTTISTTSVSGYNIIYLRYKR